MITHVLLFFCWLFPFFAAAQFNDSLTHMARFSAAGNINRTNLATSYLLNNEVRYSVKKPRTVLNTSAGWIYGQQGDILTNNDVNTSLDFNLYNQRGNFYYWGLATYTSSLSLQINNQLQAGLGVAYNFVNNTNTWINLSDGILYETSSLAISNTADENYQTFRNSLRLVYRFLLWDLVSINGSNFLQNSLKNSDDYIIRSTNSAGLKLNKWLSFTTSVTYNQFRRTGSENLLFTYGLTAEKYF